MDVEIPRVSFFFEHSSKSRFLWILEFEIKISHSMAALCISKKINVVCKTRLSFFKVSEEKRWFFVTKLLKVLHHISDTINVNVCILIYVLSIFCLVADFLCKLLQQYFLQCMVVPSEQRKETYMDGPSLSTSGSWSKFSPWKVLDQHSWNVSQP